MSRPDLAIVIGAMKAGTTTLFERLSRHPDVAPSSPKEPNFFASRERFDRGAGWYQARFPDGADDRVRLEASTAYTKRPAKAGAAERMHRHAEEHGLDVRLIYSMRDPVERIRSHVTQLLAGGEFLRPVESFQSGSISGHVLCTSMYGFQLAPYLERFGRERIHLIRFERLREDLDAVLDEATTFLDLDPRHLPQGESVHNPSSGKYRKSWLWKRLEDLHLDALTGAIPEAVMEPVRRSLGERVEGHVEITADQRAAILHALEADLRQLRDDLGVDVGGWTLPASMEDG